MSEEPLNEFLKKAKGDTNLQGKLNQLLMLILPFLKMSICDFF